MFAVSFVADPSGTRLFRGFSGEKTLYVVIRAYENPIGGVRFQKETRKPGRFMPLIDPGDTIITGDLKRSDRPVGAWGTGIYQNSEADDFLRKIVFVSTAAAKAAGAKTVSRESTIPKDAVPTVIEALRRSQTPAERLVALDLACEMGAIALIKELRRDTIDSITGELSPERLAGWRDVRERRDTLDALRDRADDIMTRKRRCQPRLPRGWLGLLMSKKNT